MVGSVAISWFLKAQPLLAGGLVFFEGVGAVQDAAVAVAAAEPDEAEGEGKDD